MIKKNKKPSNRDVALRAAASLFLTKGYHATSMDEIAAESKVSKTNIYYYFKSKEELLSAIFDGLIQTYTEMIHDAASRRDLTVQERFETLFNLLVQQKPDCLGGCPFLTLYAQLPQDAVPLIQGKVSGFFRSQIATVEALLDEGVKRKELRADLPAGTTAQFIVSAIEGALFLQQVMGSEAALPQNFLHTLAYMLK
ncbi:TetR/AcrR family transcriptional regulator [Paenibacillus hamazuiensis]|uniref:TetR/AcrR family transcriptional regulator n=1 Tax=Paenibacillus hamazuiensis TaxID=2936508 RepID=UPI00200E7477|nr:TetR/AcrR family transcriptional regulator [Paenibacillus hamazuiensis]